MQAPTAHGFLMVFMFFSGFVLVVESNGEKTHLVSILPFIYSMIFVGMAIGTALEKVRQTYIWSINKNYKRLHNTVLIALPLSIFFIFMSLVILAGSGHEIFILLGLVILYTMIFAHDWQKSSLKIVLVYMPFVVLLQSKAKGASILNNNYGLLILFAYYSMILIESLVRYRENKGYREASKDNKPKNMLLIHRFKALQPNYSSKDVGLSLSNNGLTFPLYGVLMGFLIVFYSLIMNVFVINELKTSIVLTLMFILNLLLFFQLKASINQVQKYAHVFTGKNHSGIKTKLVKAMDKILLLNNLSFIGIVLIGMYMFDLPFDQSRLVISLFMSLIFFFNTYIFIMAAKTDTRFEFVAMSFIFYIILFLALQALIDKYEAHFLSWSLNLGILFIAMLFRYFAYQRFMAVKFENIVV